ncbi:hypothetical protein CANCADRAFT_3664 [Tortispora caseinolytica NRRL Y-17796]|uniref:Nudix hydrolase domain-containing protein n=1 Tax=Tortispora caseinolytica NRRL Y-17796 TaxID=767744 RepID=A0A1E4TB92_9ASCO|nr:hypothetical protein CANCADRAFT_3664 [Tortispora caseinolytica NRRL Y-17796]
MDLSKAKVQRIEPLQEQEARWVQLKKLVYLDPMGVERTWEFASRTTRVEGSDCDGVGIIAIIVKEEGPEIVVQKQYRAPVDKVCIELPAGLLDPNETILECAQRELMEECGLKGVPFAKDFYKGVPTTSVLMFNDPGFCNTNLKLVTLSVDPTDPINLNPKPQLEPNEFIESFSIPLKDLPIKLREFFSEGYAIDARVQNISMGILLSEAFLR